jgi:trans-aconitate methyltransferase
VLSVGQALGVSTHWDHPEHAAGYLTRADHVPHRAEGDGVLVGDLAGCLPGRLLDLGCGDGRLTELLLAVYPGTQAVCVDFSEMMLAGAAERLGTSAVVVRHDLTQPLPSTGPIAGSYDAVVSSFALHHLPDSRKQTLFAELAARLSAGGVLADLDIVASPTEALHARWREEMGSPDDPSDLLSDLEEQLGWLRRAGLDDVDCIWKWRSLALMRGQRR